LDYFIGCKTFASGKPSINSLTQRKWKKKLKLLSQSHHKLNKIQTPDHWDYTYKQCQSLSCHMLYSPPLGTANLATNSKALVTRDSQQLHQYKEEHKSLQYYDHNKIAICKYVRTQDATIFTDKTKVLSNKKFHDSLSLRIIVSTRAN
jgi:hypothetical protein